MSRAKIPVLAAALLALGWPLPSQGYRMQQGPASGWATGTYAVDCDALNGFASWSTRTVDWYLNNAGQGSGKEATVQQALTAWNSSSNYNLRYMGTTGGGFMVRDSQNTISWSTGANNPCANRSCGGLTALYLTPSGTANGQTILEADILLNSEMGWMTDGTYSPRCWDLAANPGTILMDTQGVLTHELGHTLGIHHPTDVRSDPNPWSPTMDVNAGCTPYARTLEADDFYALQCSENRYPMNPAYEGYVDQANCRSIVGWAWNANRPNDPSYVEIRNGSQVLQVLAANQYRADLLQAGKGNGVHGFSYAPSLNDGQWHSVSVVNSGNGSNLFLSPRDLICSVSMFTNLYPQSLLDTGGQVYTVATQFRSSVSGYVKQLRFFKAPNESGTNVIHLWTDGGAELASVDVSGCYVYPYGGWCGILLPEPGVWITANTLYRVGVNTNFQQSKTNCGIGSGITNGPLTATQGFWIAGNTFPTTGSCSNFFVDVVFDM